MRTFIITLALSLVVAGCATTERTPPQRLTGNPTVDTPTLLTNGPSRDKVLWQYRTAATAMHRGQFDEAKQLLDDALLTIGGIIGKDAEARKARGYFSPERSKTFIGEPYERVMAYYYRGLLYWRDGELDNARACFRSAQLIDSVAESENYQSDYVLLDYLDGLASAKGHGDSMEWVARGGKVTQYSCPPCGPAADVLIFLEGGNGPRKYAGGDYGEQLRFRVDPSKVRSATLTSLNKTIHFTAWDNLQF